MATIKWKNLNNIWETFYHGSFLNTKAQLKNIILSINNAAKAIRMRCRRDKNLSDIYDAADGRTNLELINDCSALSRAPHHHDSRYIPLIEAEEERAKAEEAAIWEFARSINSCTCSGGGGGGSGTSIEDPPDPVSGPFWTFSDNEIRGDECYNDNGENFYNNPLSVQFNAPHDGNALFTINMSWNDDGKSFQSGMSFLGDKKFDYFLTGLRGIITDGSIRFRVNVPEGNIAAGDGMQHQIPITGSYFSWSASTSMSQPVRTGTNTFDVGLNASRYNRMYMNHIDVTAQYV